MKMIDDKGAEIRHDDNHYFVRGNTNISLKTVDSWYPLVSSFHLKVTGTDATESPPA
jgi:hypothetical protein